MFFKKKKIASKKKSIFSLPYFVWALGVTFIALLAWTSVHAVNNLNFDIFNFVSPTGSSVLDFSQDPLWNQKDQDEIQYILITWRGWGNHDAPNLTDTIILAGFNPTHQTISLFSLPRDLYVTYPNGRGSRINGIYETYLSQWKDVAMQKLTEKVSEITGKDVQYYINIDFKGFIEVVDALGWVEVTLDENLVDYEYPNGPWRYKTFILKKWTWTLDWEVALMYARSRHSTSDFDRSLRQQQIISGLKDKAANLWYFKDRKKILQLYSILNTYVETNIPVTEMLQQWMEVKSWENSQILSFNLNDTCYYDLATCQTGGFLYVPLRELFGWASVLLPKWSSASNPSNYEVIHTYSDLIYDSPDIYANPNPIVIYNTTATAWLAQSIALDIKPYGFSINPDTGIASLKEESFENSILYYNSIQETNETLQALKNLLNIPIQKTDTPLYSPPWTTLELILAWDDISI